MSLLSAFFFDSSYMVAISLKCHMSEKMSLTNILVPSKEKRKATMISYVFGSYLLILCYRKVAASLCESLELNFFQSLGTNNLGSCLFLNCLHMILVHRSMSCFLFRDSLFTLEGFPFQLLSGIWILILDISYENWLIIIKFKYILIKVMICSLSFKDILGRRRNTNHFL